MKNLVFLTLCICVVNVLAKTGTGTSTANCPALGICNAVYNNALTVLRADDGDVIAPSDGQSCSDLLADCTGDGCSSCKCPADADTFNNDKERCENYDKKADIIYSRGGLAINTSVSTVYFAKNVISMYELRSVATGAELPLVTNVTNIDLVDCELNKMKVSTVHTKWEEVSLDGYSFSVTNGKGFIQIDPSGIKVQPEHLQGQFVEIEFQCTKKQKLYFKIQGKSVNLDKDCLDCDGNFEYLEHLAFPEFPKPDATVDTPINFALNAIQRKGSDVSGCNEDTSVAPYISYYTTSGCSLDPVPGDNLLYATGTNVVGRNLDPSNQNAVHWNTITNTVVKMNVRCSNKDFCVMFHLTNSSSVCSGNPCKNGGNWLQNGMSSCYCQCPVGFTGADCSIGQSCADNPCCDGATCAGNGNSYTCSCPVGKTGSTCCDDIDLCTSNPCSDGATCTSNVTNFECICPVGKTGTTCDEDIDYCAGSLCADGATCNSDNLLLTFKCFCPPGKTGTTCDEDIDYCAGSPCADGATCNSDNLLLTFKCSCPPGKTGTTCDEDIDYCAGSPCADGATCNSDNLLLTFKCSCPPGKTGTTCDEDIDYCAGSPCADGATCNSDNLLLTFKCSCPPGKTGTTCDEDIDYCAGSPCADGATCTSDPRSQTFECSCPPGKTGTTCDEDIDYCAGSPCTDGATCTSDTRSQTFECSCPPDIIGQLCDTRIEADGFDGSKFPDAQTQEDNKSGSSVPVLPIVYALLGVAFLVVVVAGIAGLLYKKVYVPLKERKSAREVLPFDNQIRDESKHYNPMYFDKETVAPDDTHSVDTQSVRSVSLSSKGIATVGVSFNNPMYSIENHYDIPNKPDDSTYEYIERRDTTASDGIYEELPDFVAVYENNNTGVQKSIYDTLGTDAELSSFEDDDVDADENIYENNNPVVTSIYNTLERDAEPKNDSPAESNGYSTLQRNKD